MQTFPDLSGIFDQFRLRDFLGEVSDRTLFGFSIRVALNEGKPLGEIVAMILDQYYDNPEAVVDIVSYKTICLIKQMTKGVSKDDLKNVRFGQEK